MISVSNSTSDDCGTTCAEQSIVCTLIDREQGTRIAEFKAAFAYLERAELFEGGFRWYFKGGPDIEAQLSDLARREHDCCRFFEFHVGSVGNWIVWEARAEMNCGPLLDEFMRLPETLKSGADLPALKQSMNVAGLTFVADSEKPPF